MSIDVKCEIRAYDNDKVYEGAVRVESHWSDSKKVVLVVGSERVPVLANDLRAAIDNATNTAKWG